MMPLEPVFAGQIVAGKYRIQRVVGRGGMAVIVEALHLQLAKRVALKLSPLARSPEQADLHEARAVARLSSEHAVRVFDCGAHGTLLYVAMELLEGQDLEELAKSSGPMFFTEAVEIVLQVCEAIGQAHAHGIVHADLKPANLFVARRPDGSRCMKVLDFGMARPLGVAMVGGSPGYAAPEQLVPDEVIDARADIWALGVILYELIAGKRPFEGRDLAETLLVSLTTPAPPLCSPRGPVPAGLCDVVMRCLAKDPEDRFGSVGELVYALAPFLHPEARPWVRRTWATLRAAHESSTHDMPFDHESSVLTDAPLARDVVLFGDADEEDEEVVAASRPRFLVGELMPARPRTSLLSIATALAMLVLLILVAREHIPSSRSSVAGPALTVGAPSTTAALDAPPIVPNLEDQLRALAPKMPLPKGPARAPRSKRTRSSNDSSRGGVVPSRT